MIEDPREVERRRLLGIEDLDGPTREDLVDALDEVSFFFYNRDCQIWALKTESFRVYSKSCLDWSTEHQVVL